MLDQFRKYIDTKHLINESDNILLTVSGGIDSMVMAHLVINSGVKSGIAHCNFNLRGTESDKDEVFVREFAENNNIPFYSTRFDTTGFATQNGISIQMAARELRFNWFEVIRTKYGYDSVAIAHNLNDNVETFLINLTRGTGITGLTGMKPRSETLIRPLLFATREQIAEFSKLNNIAFREDKSNSEVKYTRNKIRHILLPVFREINPAFDLTIMDTAERLGEINEIVSEYISSIRKKIFRKRNDFIVFRTVELKDIPFKRTVIFELVRPFGVGSGQLDDMINLTDGSTGNQLFTETHRLVKNRDEIIITLRKPVSKNYFEVNSIEDLQKVPGIISARIRNVTGSFKIPDSPDFACLDAEKIEFPLIIRQWVSGDIFYPLGMKTRKKLSDYFIDRKYSIPEKENTFILESSGKIVWIVGERIDNRFRITKSTRSALVIRAARS
jgi:tRNA(Ile)-lysidine synthase